MQRITRDVIENYLDCRYKAYLKLTGHGDSKGTIRDCFWTEVVVCRLP